MFRPGPLEIGLIFLLIIYFVPTIVAIIRNTRDFLRIMLLNIFGGWTFVGWVIALVWSFRNERRTNSRNDNT